MKRFRVDLKTFLGLAMSNQCCHAVTKSILGWFVGEIFRQETPNLNDPTTVLYDSTVVLYIGIIKFWLKIITPKPA